MTVQLAPGSRITARDEEWLVRRVNRTQIGALLLTVTGLSPLVRDREARRIDQIERELNEPVSVFDPRTTVPVRDSSPYYRDTRLFLEALLRQATPADGRLCIASGGDGCAALPAQPSSPRSPAAASADPDCRCVGLGKTIECGVLLSEQDLA